MVVSTLLALNVSAPTRRRARGLLEMLWPAEDDVWVLTETSAGEGTRLVAQVCRAAGHGVHATDLAAAGGRGVMVVTRRPGLRAADPDLPAVVLGDLNLVDPLHDDDLPHVLPEETTMLAALGREHGLVDAFRHLHPTSRQVSWVDRSGAGCRYDHAFVTPDLVPQVRACDLVQAPREDGLTDHAALRLELGSA